MRRQSSASQEERTLTTTQPGWHLDLGFPDPWVKLPSLWILLQQLDWTYNTTTKLGDHFKLWNHQQKAQRRNQVDEREPVSSPSFGFSENQSLLPTIVLSPYTLATPCSWHYWFRVWYPAVDFWDPVSLLESVVGKAPLNHVCSHRVPTSPAWGPLGFQFTYSVIFLRLNESCLILFFIFGRFNFYQGLTCI